MSTFHSYGRLGDGKAREGFAEALQIVSVVSVYLHASLSLKELKLGRRNFLFD